MIQQVLHWVVFAVYWFGWLLSIRPLAVRQLGRRLAANQSAYDRHCRERGYRTEGTGGPPLTDWDRGWALVIGMVVALAWPIAVPFGRVARGLRAPQEVAAAEKAELDALRKQAHALGLDMPDAEATR